MLWEHLSVSEENTNSKGEQLSNVLMGEFIPKKAYRTHGVRGMAPSLRIYLLRKDLGG